jgi:hypothetical protein
MTFVPAVISTNRRPFSVNVLHSRAMPTSAPSRESFWTGAHRVLAQSNVLEEECIANAERTATSPARAFNQIHVRRNASRVAHVPMECALMKKPTSVSLPPTANAITMMLPTMLVPLAKTAAIHALAKQEANGPALKETAKLSHKLVMEVKFGPSALNVKEHARTCTSPAQQQAVKILDASVQALKFSTKAVALTDTNVHAIPKERATQLRL